MSPSALYIGWRDMGPHRKGRVWTLHATADPRELDRPPFHLVSNITRWRWRR